MLCEFAFVTGVPSLDLIWQTLAPLEVLKGMSLLSCIFYNWL